jgi:uncharacterized protein with von Willebrand factor type A (vWA) domain
MVNRRRSRLLDAFLAFGRLLHRLGLDVHPGRMIDLTEALTHIDLRRRDDVYHACRTLLVHRQEDLAVFDRAFQAFWDRRQRSNTRATGSREEAGPGPQGAGTPQIQIGDARDGDTVDGIAALRAWSDAARLANKDFAEFTAEEIQVATDALARLDWTPGERRTRRWVPGRGVRLDIQRALRRSVRTGGDLASLPRRTRRRRERAVIFLCDVSGSMDRYSRMLLHFGHTLGRRHRRLEAFLFSTQLTPVTADLRRRRIDEAVTAVSRTVRDWSGGTRIGEALRSLRRPAAKRVLYGRPVVLLISDGWDRGDPQMLRDEMARLQRAAHRVIWLSPLAGTPDYAPLTRGLQAALPFVDDFLPARTLENLADLAIHLNALADR